MDTEDTMNTAMRHKIGNRLLTGIIILLAVMLGSASPARYACPV